MDYPRLVAHFTRLRADASVLFPRVRRFGLVIDDRAGRESERARAWTVLDPPWEIGVASQLEKEEDSRIEGVLRHELGHACDLVERARLEGLGLKLERTPELRADQIARFIWGESIGYDAEEIQTTGGGTGRPDHLPR